MSQKEIDRLNVLIKVQEGQLTQIKASRILHISDRQIRNLLCSLALSGAKGIISKKRGKESNRKSEPLLKSLVLKLIYEKYEGFGPTLAAEKLLECDNLRISRETLRQWMIEAHLWVPKLRKRSMHPLRKRREFFGEMIQGDGSHHDWFSNGSPCTLLLFIDDATNIITAARFEMTESLAGYFEILKQHLNKYGRPCALYTDKFSVFETSCKKENLTQFRRALENLNIEWIGANSPQAKGRIERCNRTLQDRLVKEMSLRGIKTIDEGNKFLEEYISILNNKFSKEPIKHGNLHRPLEQGIDLSRTLSKYEQRTLTKDLIFQLHGKHYRIFEPIKDFCIKKTVEIRSDRNGNIRVFMGNRELKFKRLDEFYDTGKIIKLETAWITKHITSHTGKHPWKDYSYKKHLKEKEIKMYNNT